MFKILHDVKKRSTVLVHTSTIMKKRPHILKFFTRLSFIYKTNTKWKILGYVF